MKKTFEENLQTAASGKANAKGFCEIGTAIRRTKRKTKISNTWEATKRLIIRQHNRWQTHWAREI